MGKKKRPAKAKGDPAGNPAAAENTAPEIPSLEDDFSDTLIIGGDDYEQRAINRRLTELGQLREEAALERKEWLHSHRILFIVIASVIVIALIFVGMKIYNDANNPLSRFNSASAKNLGSSFSFHVTAETGGETMMTYDGAMRVKPSDQRVEIAYDADYGSYSYSNVIYTYDNETYKGNYYNGQWTLSTVSGKVEDFFDFYKDYSVGRFDGGSFLRFTELSSEFAAYELTNFVNSLKGRFTTDNPAAKITSSHNDEDGSTMFRYDLSLIAIADIIREEGAPAFFRSRDYDSFVAKLEANRESLKEAECVMKYTITSSGYLSELEIELIGDESNYVLRCEMSDFGTAEPEIPEEFYRKASIDLEAK